MNNKTECPGCGYENDLFRSNCTECGFLLRDKVPNIDLWSTFWNIFYSPGETFRRIIWSEHKNFLAVFIFFFSLKIYFDQIILNRTVFKGNASFGLLNLIFIILAVSVFAIIISVLFTKMSALVKTNTRWKDNFAVIVYSQLPLIISVLVILPSAYALFGKYLVSTNPFAYELKPLTAYFFLFLEAVCILWSFWLLFYSVLIQTGSKIIGILVSLLFFAGTRFIAFFLC